MQKILVVEDERKTAAYLRKGLTENGLAVDVAGRGDEGLRLASTGGYSLVILDVMLPERDGWSVLAELRRGHSATPVLLLTARDAVRDRVKGLELGAADYLVKPFAFSELLARVRRKRYRGEPRWCFGLPKTASVLTGDVALVYACRRRTRGSLGRLVMKRFCALLAAGLTLLGLACASSREDKGAKGETFPVKGKVYLDGQPLAGVFVVFHPIGGGADAPRAYGRTANDGTFTLSTYAEHDGAPPGQYAVTIMWPDGESPVPMYASPESSGLRAEVKSGANEPAPFRLHHR